MHISIQKNRENIKKNIVTDFPSRPKPKKFNVEIEKDEI